MQERGLLTSPCAHRYVKDAKVMSPKVAGGLRFEEEQEISDMESPAMPSTARTTVDAEESREISSLGKGEEPEEFQTPQTGKRRLTAAKSLAGSAQGLKVELADVGHAEASSAAAAAAGPAEQAGREEAVNAEAPKVRQRDRMNEENSNEE